MAPLRAAARRSFDWEDYRRQRRRLRRARKGTIDTIEISAEAVYRFAALRFDPRHITYDEARSLARILQQAGVIDRRMENSFNRSVASLHDLATLEQPDFPQNLIARLDELAAKFEQSRRDDPDLSVALEILRSVDIRRRGLPPSA